MNKQPSKPANWPSQKPGKPSGPGRDNNPPKPSKPGTPPKPTLK